MNIPYIKIPPSEANILEEAVLAYVFTLHSLEKAGISDEAKKEIAQERFDSYLKDKGIDKETKAAIQESLSSLQPDEIEHIIQQASASSFSTGTPQENKRADSVDVFSPSNDRTVVDITVAAPRAGDDLTEREMPETISSPLSPRGSRRTLLKEAGIGLGSLLAILAAGKGLASLPISTLSGGDTQSIPLPGTPTVAELQAQLAELQRKNAALEAENKALLETIKQTTTGSNKRGENHKDIEELERRTAEIERRFQRTEATTQPDDPHPSPVKSSAAMSRRHLFTGRH